MKYIGYYNHLNINKTLSRWGVGYYNPARWIDSTDELIDYIENIVRSPKNARQTSARRRLRSRPSSPIPSFLPPNSFELEIVSIESGDILLLREWVDREGKISIDLIYENEHFRKGHFKHLRFHHNPNGRNISPNHIHFPTVLYDNIMRQHTYAYPVDEENFVGALRRFCNDTNIVLEGITIPLLRG